MFLILCSQLYIRVIDKLDEKVFLILIIQLSLNMCCTFVMRLQVCNSMWMDFPVCQSEGPPPLKCVTTEMDWLCFVII